MQAERRLTALSVTAIVLALAILPAAAQTTESAHSRATLPLTEILRLYREADAIKRKPQVAPPPIPASVQALELQGRVLDDAVDFTARFRVVVLAHDVWSRVPLLKQDELTHISELPAVEGGVLAVDGDYLSFITRRNGSYDFRISFLRQAERNGRQRELSVEYAGATLAVCRLAVDDSSFRLTTSGAIGTPEGVVLYPENDAFVMGWERRSTAAKKKETRARPAVESVVTIASASTVSTLEGQRITRIRYEMQLAGRRPIEVTIPTGQVVQRAYLNGVSVPVDRSSNSLPLEVTPTREGDESGTLELVLSEAGRGYLLSGTLGVELPRISWPINEIYLDVFLPEVFNYTWVGGSLAPVEQSPDASFTYNLPLPGKRISFHQYLVSASIADVKLEYAVDLEGYYFRP